jgi:hypothetical protein
MRPEPPPPGTWRRDDGATSFMPKGVAAQTPTRVTQSQVIEPLKSPAPGPEMAPCPYCDKFEYEVPLEGQVSPAILGHVEAAHPEVWKQLQKGISEAEQAIEKEFTS